MGILAALVGRERARGRPGALVETSLLEAITTLTIDAQTQTHELGADPVRNSRHPQAQNFCVDTADGGGISVHLSNSQKFWKALARVTGREDLIDDPRFRTYDDRRVPENYEELVRLMEEAFAKRTRAEWETMLVEADVPFAPVLTMSEMARHEQTRWLQLIGPEVDGLPMVRSPFRLDGARPERSPHTPLVGEHTREVLREVCSERELDERLSAGDIAVTAKDTGAALRFHPQ
jgi:formyl-CoA transferase